MKKILIVVAASTVAIGLIGLSAADAKQRCGAGSYWSKNAQACVAKKASIKRKAKTASNNSCMGFEDIGGSVITNAPCQ